MKLRWLHKAGDGKSCSFVKLRCEIIEVTTIVRLKIIKQKSQDLKVKTRAC